MKTRLQKIGILIAIVLLFTHFGYAQLNGFELTPSGNTENYLKYIRKAVSVNGTSYYTGYLTLSPFKNVSTGAYYNDITPFQKLQIQGGNILLCSGNGPGALTDINPTSRNGAILFSDWASASEEYKHGKWGIEYDNQYSTGGLNFFKPVSQLTSSRINFNLFISNSGNVGVGCGDPVAKFQVKDGDIFIEDINRGIIMKSPDGNCWRGVLNNSGQLEFILLPDCNPVTGTSAGHDVNPGVIVRPNPASGFLMIDVSAGSASQFTAYKLLDSSGKEVKSGKIMQLSTRVDVGSIKGGIYFLQLSGENSFWSEKVILQQ